MFVLIQYYSSATDTLVDCLLIDVKTSLSGNI